MPSLDERWATWRARGAAHDRAGRRRMAVGAPIVVAAAAVAYFVFLR